MLIAGQPAQAMTAVDGTWTVSHGGTGQVFLNADGTYTSTCVVYPNYPDAWCPSPSGTFLYSSGYADFHGADGVNSSYRVSGLVTNPDTITSYFGSRTDSPLVMKRGTVFNCTDWDVAVNPGPTNPLAEYDATTGQYYLTGSHEPILGHGVAETAPNYFRNGSCADLLLPIHVSIADESTYSSYDGTWSPTPAVTVTDSIGGPALGVSITAQFGDYPAGTYDCSNFYPTCALTAPAYLPDSTPSIGFRVLSVSRNYAQLPIADGDSLQLTLNNPHTSTPTPTPSTTTPTTTTTTPAPTTTTPTPTPTTTTTAPPAAHHIGDLDNVTTSSSSLWQPKVTATVLDSTGATVTGATVSGTFSNHSGTLTCVTAADGTCTLGDFSFKRPTKSTVFTVTGVAKASSTYMASANSDPDGDSNGTTITVMRP